MENKEVKIEMLDFPDVHVTTLIEKHSPTETDLTDRDDDVLGIGTMWVSKDNNSVYMLESISKGLAKWKKIN